MTKKKKKESWKERRQRAALKHQKAAEAERLRRKTEPKKIKGWPKGKIFGVAFMFSLIIGICMHAVGGEIFQDGTWYNRGQGLLI